MPPVTSPGRIVVFPVQKVNSAEGPERTLEPPESPDPLSRAATAVIAPAAHPRIRITLQNTGCHCYMNACVYCLHLLEITLDTVLLPKAFQQSRNRPMMASRARVRLFAPKVPFGEYARTSGGGS